MGIFFGTARTPEEELLEARKSLQTLAREFEREARREGERYQSARILAENAVHDGDTLGGRNHMFDAVTANRLANFYQREARTIRSDIAGLNQTRANVVLDRVMMRLARAVNRVVTNVPLTQFQHVIMSHKQNIEQLSFRREHVEEAMTLQDDDADELGAGEDVDEEVERLLDEAQDKESSVMFADAPEVLPAAADTLVRTRNLVKDKK